jgi:hypothetical protein
MKKKGKRNGRKWLENDDTVWLDKSPGIRILVRVLGMEGDTKDGEVIYTVEELTTRERYPASDRNLKADAALTGYAVAEWLEAEYFAGRSRMPYRNPYKTA